jgi:hypothetical protein
MRSFYCTNIHVRLLLLEHVRHMCQAESRNHAHKVTLQLECKGHCKSGYSIVPMACLGREVDLPHFTCLFLWVRAYIATSFIILSCYVDIDTDPLVETARTSEELSQPPLLLNNVPEFRRH